jgi:DNA primase
MRFPPSFLDEIRARVPVSDVVGRRVKLQRRGREFVGLSPFSNEKTPSFTVNDQKGFYHCFSTGNHGDIFKFLTEVEGLPFPEAVERLAGEAGLDVPKMTAEDAEREKVRASLYDVMEAAAAWFEGQLNGREGADALRYLQGRRLDEATRAEFRLGYAPKGRYGLKEHLAARNITQQQMAEAGLLVTGDDIPVSFDRFRDRVMFPIPDSRGRIIAFGGRALSADAQAKYLNSPETPLFHKGHTLYSYARARKAAHDAGTVLVAEGYMDVIALHRAGFTHAVAPLGTALTDRQLALLWRLAPEPVLCFDGDRAGIRAAHRAVDVALPALAPGRTLRFAFLPEGLDPDDLIRAEGPDAMTRVLGEARPLIDILWAREAARPLDAPEARAAFEADLERKIATIADDGVRHHYRQAIRQRLREFWRPEMRKSGGGTARGRGGKPSDWDELRRTHLGWQRPRRPAPHETRPAPAADPSLDFSRTLEWRHRELAEVGTAGTRALSERRAVAILVALINHPRLVDTYAEEIAGIELAAPELDSLRCRIIDIAASAGTLEDCALGPQLREEGRGALLDRLERAAEQGGDWFARADAAFEDAEIGWRQAMARQRKANSLQGELDAAERALGDDMTEVNFERLKAAQTALASFEGNEASIDGYDGTSGRPGRQGAAARGGHG